MKLPQSLTELLNHFSPTTEKMWWEMVTKELKKTGHYEQISQIIKSKGQQDFLLWHEDTDKRYEPLGSYSSRCQFGVGVNFNSKNNPAQIAKKLFSLGTNCVCFHDVDTTKKAQLLIKMLIPDFSISDKWMNSWSKDGKLFLDKLSRVAIDVPLLSLPWKEVLEKRFDFEQSNPFFLYEQNSTKELRYCIEANKINEMGREENEPWAVALSLAVCHEWFCFHFNANKSCSMEQLASNIICQFGVGGGLFLEQIGMIRAFHLVWSLFCREWNIGKDIFVRVRGIDVSYNKSCFVAPNNLIRSTFGAMVGLLSPMNELFLYPEYFMGFLEKDSAYRIAALLPSILMKEGRLSVMNDPLAGCYSIEKKSNDIAQKAWDIFREIERRGGYLECLNKHTYIQKGLIGIIDKNNMTIDFGQAKHIGLNCFVQPTDKPQVRKQISDSFSCIQLAQQEIEMMRSSFINKKKDKKDFWMVYWDTSYEQDKIFFSACIFLFSMVGVEVINKPKDANKLKCHYLLCSYDSEIDNKLVIKKYYHGIYQSIQRIDTFQSIRENLRDLYRFLINDPQ